MKNRHVFTGSSKRKKISIVVLILLLVGGGLWLLHPWQKSAIEIAREKGNVSGQLDRENAQKNNKKSSKSSNSSDSSSTDQNLQTVTPVLSRWDAATDPVEVAGYVPGIFEDGGTCSYTFTRGSVSFTKTTSGFQDATHTSCAPADVNRSSFSQDGTWSVILKYKSVTSVGSSNEQSFTLK